MSDQIQSETRRTGGWDRELEKFLREPDQRKAQRCLDRLYSEFLSATVTDVLREEIRLAPPTSTEEFDENNNTFNDLSLTIQAALARRLWALWMAQNTPADAREDPILNLRAYVIVTSRNACIDYFRRKYPGRHSLDHALRTALDAHPALRRWQVREQDNIPEWRCGAAEWQIQKVKPVALRSDSALQDHLRSNLEGVSRGQALEIVFQNTQAPLRYVELLDFLAHYWDVDARQRDAARQWVPFQVQKPYQSGLQPEAVVQVVGILHNFWRMIRLLSPPQAATLLLKLPLHDSRSLLELLVQFKIADWPTLARVMRLTEAELSEVAHSVPLDDEDIARLLKLPIEKIARIRQDARRRLTRLQEREAAQKEAQKNQEK